MLSVRLDQPAQVFQSIALNLGQLGEEYAFYLNEQAWVHSGSSVEAMRQGMITMWCACRWVTA